MAEVSQLPTIASAADLAAGSSGGGARSGEAAEASLGPGLGGDWAAAVERNEPWTKMEPWASIYRREQELALEVAAQTAAQR